MNAASRDGSTSHRLGNRLPPLLLLLLLVIWLAGCPAAPVGAQDHSFPSEPFEMVGPSAAVCEPLTEGYRVAGTAAIAAPTEPRPMTLDDCCRLCFRTANCIAWSWNARTTECLLRAQVGWLLKSPDFVSLLPPPDGGPPDMRSEIGEVSGVQTPIPPVPSPPIAGTSLPTAEAVPPSEMAPAPSDLQFDSTPAANIVTLATRRCAVLSGRGFTGANLSVGRRNSAQSCCQECRNSPIGCFVWAWDRKSRSCLIGRGAGRLRRASNKVTGRV